MNLIRFNGDYRVCVHCMTFLYIYVNYFIQLPEIGI